MDLLRQRRIENSAELIVEEEIDLNEDEDGN
jgi:hypothetical protein